MFTCSGRMHELDITLDKHVVPKQVSAQLDKVDCLRAVFVRLMVIAGDNVVCAFITAES